MAVNNRINLTGLSTREAVADAFYRIMLAFDENDSELLHSGMASNIVLNINGKEVAGFEDVKKHSFDTVGPMDTTHFITNIRIDVENDSATTASMSANTLAQHYPRKMGTSDSTRRLLGGSKHNLRLVKDKSDGLWKVEKWMMKTVWHEGDFSVMLPQNS